MVYFVFKGYDVFVCIWGNFIVELCKEVIDKYWFNLVEVWFEKGKDDFFLLMFCFEFIDVEVWDVDFLFKGMFKMFIGIIVKLEEMGEYEKVDF